MEKRTCTKCVLHSRVPGVTIQEDGRCTSCSTHDNTQHYEKKLNVMLTQKMEDLFCQVREQSNLYDAVVLFSGGKDSTFLLKLAKEKYHLRVLAISVIHPLVNDVAAKNMEDVARQLDINLLKFHVQESVYKKVMRQGILEGEKYGLDEFFGCSICCFFHFWIPIQIAANMQIPIVLEGSDLGQLGKPFFHDGYTVKNNIANGEKPFGRFHDLMNDVLGDDYRNSIYGFDKERLISGSYPTLLSPFTFLDYDYKNSFDEIEQMGLKRKNFGKVYTNCSLIPFLSCITLEKYDCVPYIKQYANEVRRSYPMLMQMSLNDSPGHSVLQKAKVEKMLAEYEQVIDYIVSHKLSAEQIRKDQKDFLKGLAPTYLELYQDEVADKLIDDLSMIPYYADFFDVELYPNGKARSQ